MGAGATGVFVMTHAAASRFLTLTFAEIPNSLHYSFDDHAMARSRRIHAHTNLIASATVES